MDELRQKIANAIHRTATTDTEACNCKSCGVLADAILPLFSAERLAEAEWWEHLVLVLNEKCDVDCIYCARITALRDAAKEGGAVSGDKQGI